LFGERSILAGEKRVGWRPGVSGKEYSKGFDGAKR
jgi:hypothetical protein